MNRSPEPVPAQPATAVPNPVVARFSIAIEQVDGFEFRVRFDKKHYDNLIVDEPAPLGLDRAPNAARILAAAVGNCLSASLVLCLQKARIDLKHLESTVEVELVRNSERRLRIGRIDVTLRPAFADVTLDLAGCLDKFEDFCVVTQSVRQGLDVQVHVDLPKVAHTQGA